MTSRRHVAVIRVPGADRDAADYIAALLNSR